MPERGLLEPAVLAPERIRPLRVEEYLELARAGAFDGEHVELLDGVMIATSSPSEVEARFVARLERFFQRLPLEWMVKGPSTYVASERSAPEPDLRVVAAKTVFEHPGRSRPAMIVEVASASQRKDLGVKARIYAGAGVDEYWVIDAARMVVYVHREPSDGAYGVLTEHARFARIAPAAFPELALSLDDLLNDRL